jgi:general secretion pathway protein K
VTPAAIARGDRGFALVAVLLVLAIVGIVGAEFAYSMRLEAAAVRAYKETIAAGHLAEAGVEQAIREIVAVSTYAAVAADGALTFYTRERLAIPRLPREKVDFGGGQYTYRLTDEEARIDLNKTPPDRVDRLLRALGLEKTERDTLVDSILDWRDANEEHRLNGAESEDTYLKLAVPYRSRNTALQSVTELLQIKGVTAAIFDGADGRPGLADAVSVKTQGLVNINTAPPVVLKALALSEAEITEIVQARREVPYRDVSRFPGRGLSVTTTTFRIEAEGAVNGVVRARVTAIVQRRLYANRPAVVMLEWSGVR